MEPELRSWQNDPAAAGRTSIEWLWTGMYSALSSANDVLTAIKGGKVINNASDTKRAETIATLMQGLTTSMIALNYDKGYVVDESSDLANLQYSTRKQLRDAAVAKLQAAATLAPTRSRRRQVGPTDVRTPTCRSSASPTQRPR
ncbi:MAG: RagB/SusD family nutrient uptake outer membrane protein [Gemmatimonadetes bacterium]|nr:RagB/SusD family nutrient uptake outer membrane protein [Gemmatimonadota bacterium]